MLKRQSLVVVSIVLMVILTLSCTPKQQDTRATTQSQPTPVATAAAKPATVSAEDAAWAQVVSAAKKEGKVTIYSFSFIGDLGVGLAKTFKERYGIQMEVVAGSGAVFLERFRVEARAGRYVADVLEGAVMNAILAKKDGLSQSFTSLPALNETGVWLFDPRLDSENHFVGYTPIINSLWANTKLVATAEEPKSWRDLLDPKWKGKMLVNDPDTMSIPNFHYIVLTRYLGFDDDYFRALGRQELIVLPNQRETDSRLARGEAPLNLTSTLASSGSLVAEGAPIKPLDMKEGVSAQVQALNVVAGAPHPNAARLFINWLLSPEGQTVNARVKSSQPLRTDVQDYTPASTRVKFTRIVILTPKELEELTQLARQRVLSKLWGR